MDYKCPGDHCLGEVGVQSHKAEEKAFSTGEKYHEKMEEGPGGLGEPGRTSWGRGNLSPAWISPPTTWQT